MDTATSTIAPDTAAPKATTTQRGYTKYYLGRSSGVWASGLGAALKLGV